MPLQLVAYAMQSRKASGLDALDELDELDVLKGLDELDDDDPVLHMLSSACRQLALSRELELDDDTPKHVPHLAMMLSTALSHLDDNVDVNLEGQPVPATAKIERTNPRSARFMSLLPTKVIRRVYSRRAAGTAARWRGSIGCAIDHGFPVGFHRAAVVVRHRW
jgi:hypothetical protein